MPDDPPTPFDAAHRRALRGDRPLTLGRLVLLPPERDRTSDPPAPRDGDAPDERAD